MSDLQTQVANAAKEMSDVISLALNDVDNKSEITLFFAEGMQAFKAMSSLVANTPAEFRAKMAVHLAMQIAVKVIQDIDALKLDVPTDPATDDGPDPAPVG